MVRTYVRHLLEEEFGEDLEVLGDGIYDVPVGVGVRVVVVDSNERSRRVLITAPVIEVDGPTWDVLEALNELNATTPYGRYFVDGDGDVMVEDTLLAAALEPTSLFGSIAFVAWARRSQAEFLVERLGITEGAGADEDDDELPTGAAATDVTVDDRVAPVAGAGPSARSSLPGEGVVNAGGYL